jgi:RNA-binding protein
VKLTQSGQGGKLQNISPAFRPRFLHHVLMSLTNAKIRELKARAQRLDPLLKVGHEGLSEKFIAALDVELTRHELVKVKFSDFKDQKKVLSPQLAEKTGSELIMRVGNVAVLFRPKPASPEPAGDE